MKTEENNVIDFSSQLFFEGPLNFKTIHEYFKDMSEIVVEKQDVITFDDDNNIILKRNADVMFLWTNDEFLCIEWLYNNYYICKAKVVNGKIRYKLMFMIDIK